MKCVLWKCGGKATGCKVNASCAKTLACIDACAADDFACPTKCVSEFGNTQFDELSVCIQQNNCLTPYPKDIDYKVPIQDSTATLSDFVGDWVTIAGLDRGLDCYENQQ
jgi:VDE lipocalin domain